MKCQLPLTKLWIASICSIGLASAGCQEEVAKRPGAPMSLVSANSTSTESATNVASSTTAPAAYFFESPTRLEAGGKIIQVESPGYACPTMADVDGDGKQDLVVGQFDQGHMQLCRNIASAGEPPRFAAAEWIKSGGERAIVPGVW